MLQADLNTALSSPFTASYSDASYSSDEEDGENPREKDQVKVVIFFRAFFPIIKKLYNSGGDCRAIISFILRHAILVLTGYAK